MSQKPTKKSVLITGCSAGGIGDALAQSFHKAGLRVFATARTLSKVQHLKDMGMEVLPLDVVDPASIKSAVEQVSDATDGKLDILVNNSGIGYNMPFLDTDPEEVRKMLDVNVIAIISTTQAFFPQILKSKGMIVNIGSVAGVAPFPWQSSYNASKAGINILSDTMRIELEPLGVKVMLVVTGGVETNFFRRDDSTMRLPPNSMYLPGKESIENLMSGKAFSGKSVGAKPYAEKVVRNVLKGSPDLRPWYGGGATVIWGVATFLWSTVWDTGLAGSFGITELKKKLKESKARK